MRGESPTSPIGNLWAGRRVGLIQFEFTPGSAAYVLRWNLYGAAARSQLGDPKMLLRWGCVAAICFVFAPQAKASEHSGLIHRASCTVIRYYVAKYSASAAETWARSRGATDAEIETARRCLKSPPARTAQAARWKTE